MSDVVDVDPETLRAHARAVDTFMGQISGATSSAGNTLNLQAFGAACIQPAQILQAWIISADHFIQKVVQAGHGVSSAISSMADQYERNEQDAKAGFDTIHGSLETKAI